MESLRECDKGRVVGRHVVPKLPHPVRQGDVRVAEDGQIGEVHSCIRRTIVAECSSQHQPVESVLELHVEKVRRMEVTVAENTVDETWDSGLSRQDADDGRRINHDHGRSRPERTASTMSSMSAPPERDSARRITSATGGRSASRVMSASK